MATLRPPYFFGFVLSALDKGPDIARKLHPVFIAHIHHVARIIILELYPLLWEVGTSQRIFGCEKGVAKS